MHGNIQMHSLQRYCRLVAIIAILHVASSAASFSDLACAPPRRVVIEGYGGDAMEPFVSRDGKFLLFNNSDFPNNNKDIRYAKRIDDFTWRYAGDVGGIDTSALEGCPTMDNAGNIFFVSTRSYDETWSTIYSGKFTSGSVTNVQLANSISRHELGIVNFDVDVSPDGTLLVFVDSRFLPGLGPVYAHLVLAAWNGNLFIRSRSSDLILARVNTDGLVYAPSISADKLTLFFTRFDAHSAFKGPQIFCSRRKMIYLPFGPAQRLSNLGAFVEGPALSPDERLLYFHRRDGVKFHIYAVPNLLYAAKSSGVRSSNN